jgi:competence protein ComEA
VDDVPRPRATTSLSQRARERMEWFGVARLVTSAVAVVVVCVGAWWLVRAPVPPSESSLPMASTPSTTSPPGADVTIATAVSMEPVPAVPPAVDASAGSAGRDSGRDVVTVHVAGAVQRAGVYELSVGSRVDAAIARAGGVTLDADPDALNLAAPLVDGTRVYVPMVGEALPPRLDAPTPALPASSTPAGPIDVNRASATELDSLPGVGPATASAIVTERERNGPFVSVDDLERVPGIGPAKLEALRDLVIS